MIEDDHRDADGRRATRRPHPSRGRERLTRERVLRTALEVVDRDGLAALSMRRVAEAMDVEPMALYRYTPSKNDLLDGLVEAFFLEAERRQGEWEDGEGAPEDGREAADWRTAMDRAALALYRAALAHPHVLPLVAARPLSVPFSRRPHAVLRTHERILAVLLEAGMAERDVVALYRRFVSWVLGYLLLELREVDDAPDEPEPAFRLGLHRLPVRDFPHLRAYGPALAGRGGEEQLLAGLHRLLEPEGAAGPGHGPAAGQGHGPEHGPDGRPPHG